VVKAIFVCFFHRATLQLSTAPISTPTHGASASDSSDGVVGLLERRPSKAESCSARQSPMVQRGIRCIHPANSDVGTAVRSAGTVQHVLRAVDISTLSRVHGQ
jgi:hypothetical protein